MTTTIATMAQPAEHREPGPPTPLPTSRSEAAEPEARSLRDHLRVLRRRWLVVLASALAAMLAALVLSLVQPTQYQSTTDVLVPLQVNTGGDASQQLQIQRFDPVRAMQDEARLATAAGVTDQVRQRTGNGIALAAKAVKDADVLQITATADTAERARAGANAAAEIYLQRHNDAVAKGTAPAVVLEPAPLPSRPSQPTTARNVTVGLIIGLLIGLALAYLVDALAEG